MHNNKLTHDEINSTGYSGIIYFYCGNRLRHKNSHCQREQSKTVYDKRPDLPSHEEGISGLLPARNRFLVQDRALTVEKRHREKSMT